MRPGRCFALYTAARMEVSMRRYQVPEIQRVPLEELVLQVWGRPGGDCRC